MKGPGLQWRVVGCGLVLLNVLLYADAAAGQLNVNPTTLSFGSVPSGSLAKKAVVVANSGTWKLSLSQASVTGSGFALTSPLAMPVTLAPGQSITFGATFAPLSSGIVSGNLSLTWTSGYRSKHKGSNSTVTTVLLSGTGTSTTNIIPPPPAPSPGQLVASPGNLSFGSVQVGRTQTLTAALTNTGGSSVTLSQATAAGIGFTVAALNLPLTLSPGQSVTFSASFAPLSAGSAAGSVSVISNALNTTLMMPLAGTGMAQGQLAVTPASADFGSVTVGTSKTQSGTLTASGSSVSVSSASTTDSEFSMSGIVLPLTIAPGQSVSYTLTFTPKASGSASATDTFTSNASNSVIQNLTGAGIAPQPHTVDLGWGSVSAVAGYNVYRGTKSGGPYTRVNSALDASTTYSDNSVQSGQVYYYVTTAVDSSGAQSGYSNESQAAIPSP
jgi:Abnormal spindle-like microcephaly-assoc'd, ASPM-SPD-2-Hydin